MQITQAETTSVVTLEDYPDLLKIRALPDYRFVSRDQIECDTADLELIGVKLDAPERSWEIVGPLFDYQRWIVDRAIERERFALFALTGTGKTVMQLEWARIVTGFHGGRTLIVAPLGVCAQTIRECAKFYTPDHLTVTNLTDRHALDAWLVDGSGVGITNYEKLDGTADHYPVGAVVLDESSMLRGLGPRKQGVMHAFSACRYRLCCTATPAPNDRDEYADHAAFLGVVRRPLEYLARYFRNTGNTAERWEFKPHAFDAWIKNLAGWAVFLRDPYRWGFEEQYDLPELVEEFPAVDLTGHQLGRAREHENGDQASLFGATPGGITSRTKLAQISNGFEIVDGEAVRFESFKPGIIADLANIRHPDERVIVWIKYREEGRQLAELIPDAIVLDGQTKRSWRDEQIEAFAAGEGSRVLVAMQSMFSHGLNLQACDVQIFSTQDDSFERRFQSIRRSLRFGRTQPVTVYTPLTQLDHAACFNTLNKASVFEEDSRVLEDAMIGRLRPQDTSEVQIVDTSPAIELDRIDEDRFTLVHADSIAHMPTMEDKSIDLAVFSPPFASLFTYSSMLGDMGNNSGDDEFELQWQWFAERLLPKMRPGRIVAVHCSDVVVAKQTSGQAFQHLLDFPGQLTSGMRDAGFLYTGRITIDKDPQAQAIRTNSQALMFNQLRRNSLNSRPALADYVILFRAPGEPDAIVSPGIDNPTWVQWAKPMWYGIRETDTLSTAQAKETDEERHICPLQLGLIDRCVELWTNPGELVFSPFAGIGSEGWSALGLGRRFYGVELKESYYRTALRNLYNRVAATPMSLFDQETVEA